MNTFKKSFATARVLLTGIILLALIANLLTYCKKSDDTPPQEYPDPAKDLIGFYNPLDGVFYIAPDYQEDILSLVEAKPLENCIYVMPNVSLQGFPTETHFMLKLVDISDIVQAQQANEMVLDTVILNAGTAIKCWKYAQCDQTNWPPKPNPSICDIENGDTTSHRTIYRPNLGICKYVPDGSATCKQFMQELGVIKTYSGITCDTNFVQETKTAGRGYRCVK